MAQVDDLFGRMTEAATRMVEAGWCTAERPVLSAGGSSYFDRVAELLVRPVAGRRPLVVLRSGCYVTHDHGTYAESNPIGDEPFRPALELIATVLRGPRPAWRSSTSAGATPPSTPVCRCRCGSASPGAPAPPGATVTRLNDQHAWMTFDPDGDGPSPSVGDTMGFGISHPCTAFDKWRTVPVVDDARRVVDVVTTRFGPSPAHVMIRLAALGLWHEANTFSTDPADEASMQRDGVLVAEAIVERFVGGTATMSGFLAAATPGAVEVVPLVMTSLVPAGRSRPTPSAAVSTRSSTSLERHGPFDGVLAALHGAAVADGCADVDGHVLARIRATVGPDVPVGAALDLHANVSAEMCRHADVLNAYRTNPHLDAHLTAAEVATIVVSACRGEVRPVVGFAPIPAVIDIVRQNTADAPMSDVLADARVVAARPGVLSASVTEGFPWADVADMGMSAIVVADGDAALATTLADQLARQVWSRREQFHGSALAPDAAIAHAAAVAGPVLLLDVGDNIGGGSGGDSVALVHAARRGALASLVAIVADPEAVAACAAAGVGAELRLRFGASAYAVTGPPVEADVTVLAMGDGRHVATGESVHAGMDRIDAGASVAVRLDSGQTVVLTSRVAPPFSIHQLTDLGLDPRSFRAIVAKGVHSPRATYAPYVSEMVMVDTPGPTTAGLASLTYRNRRRPLFPFEPDTPFPVRRQAIWSPRFSISRTRVTRLSRVGVRRASPRRARAIRRPAPRTRGVARGTDCGRRGRARRACTAATRRTGAAGRRTRRCDPGVR